MATAKKKSRSGTVFTEAMRAESGKERIVVRPNAGTKAKLERLAKLLGMTSTAAVEAAIARTLAFEIARAKAG